VSSLQSFKPHFFLLCLAFSNFSFGQTQYDSITFTIHATNLSEDKNILPIKNDEIIFQLYSESGSEILAEPLLYELMLFDEKNLTQKIARPTLELGTSKTFYFFLTEYEYDKSYEQRSPIYRIYYQQIQHAFDSSDLVRVKRYLGSDDLLGARTLQYEDLTTPTVVEFNGVQNFEKYGYEILINQE